MWVGTRLWNHVEDGDSASTTWTVHLANKKAANPARGNSGSAANLTIDPGSRTINGPNQRKVFDTGTITLPGTAATNVPLGEIRSDTNNHLLVLGGFGTSGCPAPSMEIGDFRMPKLSIESQASLCRLQRCSPKV